MLGIAMEKWPDDALRRVVDAPVERWRMGSPDGGAATCLYGHVGGKEDRWAEAARVLNPELHGTWASSWGYVYTDYPGGVCRFDSLCHRFGPPRTVRAIKLRALAILLRRHPLDAKIVVLRAEVG